jgi:monovalent cation/proton antiporter MnhG/PhaG subunit
VTGTLVVEVMLAVSVITTMLCCLGILIMPDFYERLHYMASVTTVSAFCILVAVAIETGWGQATIKTVLVCIVLLLINAVLTHATARACRVRELGHWTPDANENIPGMQELGEQRSHPQTNKG